MASVGAAVPNKRNQPDERRARLERRIEETRVESEELTTDARELSRRIKVRKRQAKADLAKHAGGHKRQTR
jgi:hypothetical protein